MTYIANIKGKKTYIHAIQAHDNTSLNTTFYKYFMDQNVHEYMHMCVYTIKFTIIIFVRAIQWH